MVRRRLPGLALMTTAAVLGALAGCSSTPEPSGDAPKVATLASAPAPATSAAKPAPERPRERLDMSDADFDAVMAPYRNCMAEHGVDERGGPVKDMSENEKPVAVPQSAADKKKYDRADSACRSTFYPLPPWEYDPANPESKDFVRDVVTCLKRKGVKYVEAEPDGVFSFGGRDNHAESISKGLEFTPACEREVAASR
jgi:hypothetical protein